MLGARSKSRLSKMLNPMAIIARRCSGFVTGGKPVGETSFGPSHPMEETPRSLMNYATSA
jgi:hypothetical protein